MTTYAIPNIDWDTFPESDGEPMAETIVNATQIVELQFGLRYLLELQGRTQVAVGGNQLMYYNPASGWDHVAPDVYVALDVPPGMRPTWKTWEEGKFPDIVFEITSPSTEGNDVGYKRELYTRLGVREYYIYDPQHEMKPPFLGFQRIGEHLEPLPALPDGSIVSPLLGAELRIVDEYVRVVDPTTNAPMLMTEEERRGRLAAEARAVEEEQARRAAEARVAAAEERAAAAVAALQALKAELARRTEMPLDRQ